MSLSRIVSRAALGVDAPPILVETHLANGLPAFNIVGLPEAAVKESKDRVRAALITAGYEFPNKRITVNLAPADLPKDGARFDLPIALGILAAAGHVPAESCEGMEFVGELALSGELRRVPGVLPAALAARRDGRTLMVPQASADEAALAGGKVVAAAHLLEVSAHLAGQERLPAVDLPTLPASVDAPPDLADVRGQATAKRALLIAAAGGHNLLMIGPPGTGKTMLASRLPGLLPDLDELEAMEVAALTSISAQGFDARQFGRRPFRSPHHTASAVALVGGGAQPKPGEISLAHHGVLFLDELPEFDRQVLEVLREPLESGRVTISRAARQAEFPARFQLVAAMNPCPCGHFGFGDRCRCSPGDVRRYLGKLSGPFLDRIDLHVEVPPLPQGELLSASPGGPDSASWRTLVLQARERQQQRGALNSQLATRQLTDPAMLAAEDRALLEQAMHKLGLSARATHRVLRVARTIADLSGTDKIGHPHLLEALSYRRLERLQNALNG